VEQVDFHNYKNDISLYALDPSTISTNTDNDTTVVTTNRSRLHSFAFALCLGLPKAIAFANRHSIADIGATSIFEMAGIPMSNICPATDPLSINLPNGDIVRSTHMCDIIIP
jgi:hypothetical protein